MKNPYLNRAIELAVHSVKHNHGGPFGAVIVKDGKIIAEGNNQVTENNDPTCHAEIVAIRNACKLLKNYSLQNCELYSSCEPCPMCLSAINWARLDKLYFAADRHQAKAAGFDDEKFYDELTKPIEKRDIPTQHLVCDNALHPFDAWNAQEDKVLY